jgi:hypothetical protein
MVQEITLKTVLDTMLEYKRETDLRMKSIDEKLDFNFRRIYQYFEDLTDTVITSFDKVYEELDNHKRVSALELQMIAINTKLGLDSKSS